MTHEFKIVFDLYDEILNDKGEPEIVLIKPNLTKRWTTELEQITGCREATTKNGRSYRTRCEVYHNNENKWVTVIEPYNKMQELINKSHKVIKVRGFRNE